MFEVVPGLWKWFSDHTSDIFSFIIFFSFLGLVWRYVSAKTNALKFHKFELYNALIRELVETGPSHEPIKLQHQTALVAQFRSFPDQFDASGRILEDLLKNWRSGGEKNPLLFNEMERTIKFIKRKHLLKTLGISARTGLIVILFFLLMAVRFGWF